MIRRDAMALRVAIDLMHMPSRVQIARSAPLPEGVYMLLCIAAGEEAEESAAVESTGRSRDVIQRAAGFFIEQVLLCPNADSYRVLGATSEATNTELRRNMAQLMRWLHPDMDPEGRRSMFASRVTLAWNDLKTAERRATYDRRKRSLPAKTPRLKSRRLSGGKRRPASPRYAHGQRDASHVHADEKRSLLRRVVAWMGALAQLQSR
jgi:DnaJ domain